MLRDVAIPEMGIGGWHKLKEKGRATSSRRTPGKTSPAAKPAGTLSVLAAVLPRSHSVTSRNCSSWPCYPCPESYMSLTLFHLIGPEGRARRHLPNKPAATVAAILLIAGLALNYIVEGHSFLKPGTLSPQMYLGAWPDFYLPIVAFFLCLTAPILYFVVMKRRETWGIGLCIVVALTISVPTSLLYGGYSFVHGFLATGTDETGECDGLKQAASASGSIPASAEYPQKPAIYCAGETYGMFFSHYEDLAIYGVTTDSGQARILHDLASYRRAAHTHSLHVGFYEKENWTSWRNPKNGAAGGERGAERLLRVVTLR